MLMIIYASDEAFSTPRVELRIRNLHTHITYVSEKENCHSRYPSRQLHTDRAQPERSTAADDGGRDDKAAAGLRQIGTCLNMVSDPARHDSALSGSTAHVVYVYSSAAICAGV